MVRDLKIFGERNTGTNAIKRLIESNSATRVVPSIAGELDPLFRYKTNLFTPLPRAWKQPLREAYIDRIFRGRSPRLSWKHAATRFQDISCFDDCPVVVTIRHPISWLTGLHRRPYNAIAPVPSEFPAFLKSQWIPTQREHLDERSMTPADLWNIKARHALAFAEDMSRRNFKYVIIGFEDFVMDQSAVFKRLRDILASPKAEPEIIERSTKDPTKDHNYYREYYGQNKWLAEIEPGAVKIAIRQVDWGIAQEFGYAVPY